MRKIKIFEPKELFLFGKDDPVEGEVCIKPTGSGKLAHTGIKVELIGQIELSYDRGNHYVFCSMHQEMAGAGELREATTYPFSFAKAEKQFESYNGTALIFSPALTTKISIV